MPTLIVAVALWSPLGRAPAVLARPDTSAIPAANTATSRQPARFMFPPCRARRGRSAKNLRPDSGVENKPSPMVCQPLHARRQARTKASRAASIVGQLARSHPRPRLAARGPAPGTSSAGSDDREPAPRDRRLRPLALGNYFAAPDAGGFTPDNDRPRVRRRRHPPFLRWLVNRGGETLGAPDIRRSGTATRTSSTSLRRTARSSRLSRRSTERASRTTSRRARPGCVRRPRLRPLGNRELARGP